MYNVSSSCDKESFVAYVGYANAEKKEQILAAIERTNPSCDFSDCTFYIIDEKPSFNKSTDKNNVYIARNKVAIALVIERNDKFFTNFIYF